MKKLFIPLIIILAGILVYAGINSSATDIEHINSARSEETPSYAAVEGSLMASEHIMAATNTIRSKQGLNRLKTSQLLIESACNKLDHMVQNNYWSHDAPDGTTPWTFIDKAGYQYKAAGENLAYGQKTTEQLMQNWMDSPTHRENIEDSKWDEQGVCTKYVRFQGSDTWLTVHHFGVRS